MNTQPPGPVLCYLGILGKKKIRITHVSSLLLVPKIVKNSATVSAHYYVQNKFMSKHLHKNIVTTSRWG